MVLDLKRPRLEYALLAGVALLLGGMILFASFWMHMHRASESDLKYVRHSREVIQKMSEFRISLLELDVAERDYLITGRDQFIENSARSRRTLWKEHQALGDLVADNAEQVARVKTLKTLLTARMSLGDELIALRDDYGLSGAQPLIAKGIDQVHNGRIQNILELMLEEEFRLLDIRRGNFDSSLQMRKDLALVSVVIILLMLSVLVWWVRRELRRRRLHVRQLDRVAHIDHVTGLPNRRQFLMTSSTLLALTRRQKGMLAVMLMDLDGFKGVNDTYGHDVGDKLLVEVGRRLRASIRASDVIARFGGDEFAVVMSEVASIDHVCALAQKLIDAIGEPYVLGEVKCASVGASIGIAWYPDHGEEVETLLLHADEALYESKRAGRRRYTIYNATLAETEQT